MNHWSDFAFRKRALRKSSENSASYNKLTRSETIFMEHFLIQAFYYELKTEFIDQKRGRKETLDFAQRFPNIRHIRTYINKWNKREKKKEKIGSAWHSFSDLLAAKLRRYPQSHIKFCPQKRSRMQTWMKIKTEQGLSHLGFRNILLLISCSFCHIEWTFQNTLSVCIGWNCMREKTISLSCLFISISLTICFT